MEKDKIKNIAITLYCSSLIMQLFITKLKYSRQIDGTELIKILKVLSDIIKKNIQDEIWKDFLEKYGAYEEPIYENNNPPRLLVNIISIGINCFEKNNINIPEKIKESVPKEIVELGHKLTEIQIFDCKFPNPEINSEYRNPKRFLFLLQKYWQIYLRILQDTGTAPFRYNPHPVVRFIANLKYRIKKCVNEVNNGSLNSAFMELETLDPIGSEEFDIEWECGGIRRVHEFEKALQEVLVENSLRNFELTEEEELFLDECGKASEYWSNKIKYEWKITNDHIKKVAKEQRGTDKNKPKTLGEYINEVESNLRELIKVVYKKNFANNYLNVLQETIEKNACLSVKESMKSRHVGNDADFIYFTQLKDLQPLISKKWNLFKDYFTIRCNEFNTLLSGIIKARTDMFHSRPEHLWPEIEKERARVLCHDLLKSIKTK